MPLLAHSAPVTAQQQLLSVRRVSARRPAHAPRAAAAPPAGVSAAERVKLGDSDLLVSRCCLGTMTWGVQNTEAEAHEQLSYAWDQGINFLDTAEMYPIPPSAETQGRTEQYIGTWLQQRRREDVILATKVSGYGRQSYLRDDGSLPRVDARNIRESVDKSLARLQTDHIDLLQIHWPDRYVPLFGAPSYDAANEREAVPFEEQLAGLEAVIRAGKVRFVGVSNETSYGVMSFVQAARQGLGLPMIVSIQNSYSLLVRGSFETGKYVAGNEEAIANARFNLFQGYMKRYRQSLACEAATAYVEVAQRHGLTPTQLALAFVSSRWFVSSTIIGATSLEQLKENIGTFDVRLSPEALADIDKVFRRYRDPAVNF